MRVLLRYTGENSGSENPIKELPHALFTIKDLSGKSINTFVGYQAIPIGASEKPPFTKIMATEFSTQSVPRKNGRLYYETEYSYNNGWPLRVRIPLRDAKGRDLLTKNTLDP